MYNIKPNLLQNIIKCNIEKPVFLFLWVSECERKCVSRFYIFGNLAFEKSWKSVFEDVCTNPGRQLLTELPLCACGGDPKCMCPPHLLNASYIPGGGLEFRWLASNET